MHRTFGSCAKSTVSVDDDHCQRQSCIELRKKWIAHNNQLQLEDIIMSARQELLSKIELQRRKIQILKKSKQLVIQQLTLAKQQNQNQSKRIKRLEQLNLFQTQKSSTLQKQDYKPNISIIVQEKQQQIQLISLELKSKTKQICQLKFINQQLSQDLESKNKMLQKIRNSTKIQLSFYQNEVAQLEEELSIKVKQIEYQKNIHLKQLKQMKDRQIQITHHYNDSIIKAENKIKFKDQQIKQLQTNFKKLQYSKNSIQQQLFTEKQKTKWLKQLIEEAKTQYIHSELKKQEERQKTTRNKNKYWSNHNQYLTNCCKSNRSISEISTSLPSANNSSSQNTSMIAPFLLSPIEKDEGEWPFINDPNSSNLL